MHYTLLLGSNLLIMSRFEYTKRKMRGVDVGYREIFTFLSLLKSNLDGNAAYEYSKYPRRVNNWKWMREREREDGIVRRSGGS